MAKTKNPENQKRKKVPDILEVVEANERAEARKNNKSEFPKIVYVGAKEPDEERWKALLGKCENQAFKVYNATHEHDGAIPDIPKPVKILLLNLRDFSIDDNIRFLRKSLNGASFPGVGPNTEIIGIGTAADYKLYKPHGLKLVYTENELPQIAALAEETLYPSRKKQVVAKPEAPAPVIPAPAASATIIEAAPEPEASAPVIPAPAAPATIIEAAPEPVALPAAEPAMSEPEAPQTITAPKQETNGKAHKPDAIKEARGVLAAWRQPIGRDNDAPAPPVEPVPVDPAKPFRVLYIGRENVAEEAVKDMLGDALKYASLHHTPIIPSQEKIDSIKPQLIVVDMDSNQDRPYRLDLINKQSLAKHRPQIIGFGSGSFSVMSAKCGTDLYFTSEQAAHMKRHIHQDIATAVAGGAKRLPFGRKPDIFYISNQQVDAAVADKILSANALKQSRVEYRDSLPGVGILDNMRLIVLDTDGMDIKKSIDFVSRLQRMKNPPPVAVICDSEYADTFKGVGAHCAFTAQQEQELQDSISAALESRKPAVGKKR